MKDLTKLDGSRLMTGVRKSGDNFIEKKWLMWIFFTISKLTNSDQGLPNFDIADVMTDVIDE